MVELVKSLPAVFPRPLTPPPRGNVAFVFPTVASVSSLGRLGELRSLLGCPGAPKREAGRERRGQAGREEEKQKLMERGEKDMRQGDVPFLPKDPEWKPC